MANFIKRFLYQRSAEPVPQETITEDKWHQPWSLPNLNIKVKSGLAIAVMVSGLVAPPTAPVTPLNPTFSAATSTASSQVIFDEWIVYESEFVPVFVPTAETVTVDKWNSPWIDPVRVPITRVSQQQSLFSVPFIAGETVTADKWLYPWSEPIRQKTGLASWLQHTRATQTALVPAVTVDEWGYRWSEPVRTRALATALQPILRGPVAPPSPAETVTASIWPQVIFTKYLIYQSVARPVFTPAEVTTVDKWIYPWSEPVRQKIGLRADLQQSFIGLTLNPDTQITQFFESRWHYPWSEPVRIKPQVPVGEQQALIQGPSQTPEFITVDKWIYGWSEPVRQKIGLKTNLQQSLIAPVLNPETQIIQTFESRWHQPWSEPVRFRRFPTAEQQALIFQSAFFETINVDKWGYAWSEPVRQKPGLKTGLQQAFIGLTLEPNTQIIQTYESRWHFAWSEPVRVRQQVPTGEQSFLIQGPVQTPEFVTVDKWGYAWTEPVRQKIGFKAYLQQSLIAPVLNPETQITQDIEARWHFAWSEPVRFRRLATAQFPSIAEPTTSVFEIITVDKWIYRLNEPVRLRIDPRRAIALAAPAAIGPVLNPETQLIQGFESRWHYPWSEPKRFKRGLGAWLQPFTTPQTPVFPTGIVRTMNWFAPLNEPVRLKIGLMAALQRFFQTSQEQILADITLVLSATETNADSAFFGVTVYNQAAPVVLPVLKAVVSIKEIPAVRDADVSLEELPEFDNADVSIEEK